MKKTLFMAVAAAFLSAPAMAQDTAFDGLYLGLQGGYGQVSPDGGDKDSGFSGGAYGGYGVTFGKLYVAGEASVDLSAVDPSVGGVDIEKEWGYGASARVGVLVGKKAVAYGIGGWERGEFKAGGVSFSDDGWKAGAGFETLLPNGLTARTEFTYTSWGGSGSAPEAGEYRTTFGVGARF